MINKFAIIAIAILAIPLALYFVPYSYAATTTSATYQVAGKSVPVGPNGGESNSIAMCNSGDYATGGGADNPTNPNTVIVDSYGISDNLGTSADGTTPIGWWVDATTISTKSGSVQAIVDCQHPISIAGIGVPEFGQLYIAIALGALVFYLIGRYMSTGKARGSALDPPSHQV